MLIVDGRGDSVKQCINKITYGLLMEHYTATGRQREEEVAESFAPLFITGFDLGTGQLNAHGIASAKEVLRRERFMSVYETLESGVVTNHLQGHGTKDINYLADGESLPKYLALLLRVNNSFANKVINKLQLDPKFIEQAREINTQIEAEIELLVNQRRKEKAEELAAKKLLANTSVESFAKLWIDIENGVLPLTDLHKGQLLRLANCINTIGQEGREEYRDHKFQFIDALPPFLNGGCGNGKMTGPRVVLSAGIKEAFEFNSTRRNLLAPVLMDAIREQRNVTLLHK